MLLWARARLLCCLLLPVLRQGRGDPLYGAPEDEADYLDLDEDGPPEVLGGPALCQDTYQDWVALYCWAPFHATLMATPEGSRCRWEQIGSAYSELSACTELLARLFSCPWPSTALDAFFLQVHAEYFSNCSRIEPSGLGGLPPGLAAAAAVGLGCLVPLAAAVTLSRARRGARSPVGSGTAPVKLPLSEERSCFLLFPLKYLSRSLARRLSQDGTVRADGLRPPLPRAPPALGAAGARAVPHGRQGRGLRPGGEDEPPDGQVQLHRGGVRRHGGEVLGVLRPPDEERDGAAAVRLEGHQQALQLAAGVPGGLGRTPQLQLPQRAGRAVHLPEPPPLLPQLLGGRPGLRPPRGRAAGHGLRPHLPHPLPRHRRHLAQQGRQGAALRRRRRRRHRARCPVPGAGLLVARVPGSGSRNRPPPHPGVRRQRPPSRCRPDHPPARGGLVKAACPQPRDASSAPVPPPVHGHGPAPGTAAPGGAPGEGPGTGPGMEPPPPPLPGKRSRSHRAPEGGVV